MAYATIAGLPVEVGLYTAFIPMLLYAIFGTSRPLSVSATSTISILTAVALKQVVQSSDPYDYIVPAATLAFITGIFLLVAGILRLGFLANFISAPVLTGFKAGIGVVIFVGQLRYWDSRWRKVRYSKRSNRSCKTWIRSIWPHLQSLCSHWQSSFSCRGSRNVSQPRSWRWLLGSFSQLFLI